MKCRCGNEKIRVYKDVSHMMFGKEIFVMDVPHLICETCGDAEYENETKLIHALRDAYRARQTKVHFDETKTASF